MSKWVSRKAVLLAGSPALALAAVGILKLGDLFATCGVKWL